MENPNKKRSFYCRRSKVWLLLSNVALKMILCSLIFEKPLQKWRTAESVYDIWYSLWNNSYLCGDLHMKMIHATSFMPNGYYAKLPLFRTGFCQVAIMPNGIDPSSSPNVSNGPLMPNDFIPFGLAPIPNKKRPASTATSRTNLNWTETEKSDFRQERGKACALLLL